jgi:hypothetical protein
MVDGMTLEQVSLLVLYFCLANHHSTLLHIHLSLPQEVFYSSDKRAHYNALGANLRGFISDPALGWSESKHVIFHYKDFCSFRRLINHSIILLFFTLRIMAVTSMEEDLFLSMVTTQIEL